MIYGNIISHFEDVHQQKKLQFFWTCKYFQEKKNFDFFFKLSMRNIQFSLRDRFLCPPREGILRYIVNSCSLCDSITVYNCSRKLSRFVDFQVYYLVLKKKKKKIIVFLEKDFWKFWKKILSKICPDWKKDTSAVPRGLRVSA